MRQPLHLYEELMLLALREDRGTVAANEMAFVYTLSGAVLAELLLLELIELEKVKKKDLVNVVNPGRVGDPIIDECMAKMEGAKRRASLDTWVSRLGGLKKLKHRVATQLCRRGILRADEKSVLLIFSKKVYPELDPEPERKIVERLREAIFTDSTDVPPATAILVSLADKAGVLKNHFDKKELKARKNRIIEIGDGVAAAVAVNRVVDGIQAAVTVAITASTVTTTAT
jgi:hypothetical protein